MLRRKNRFFVLFFLCAVCISCLGKQIPQSTRKRFIPEENKTIYIGSILNNSPDILIDQKMWEYLAVYFRNNHELLFTQNLQGADIYLDIEIDKILEHEIMPLNRSQSTRDTRLLVKLAIGLKDIKNKKPFIENEVLEISVLYKKDLLHTIISDTVYNEIFKNLAENIEHLIRFGSQKKNTQFGYEGLDVDKNGTLLERSFQGQDSRKVSSDDYLQQDDNSTNINTEINRRDTEGQY